MVWTRGSGVGSILGTLIKSLGMSIQSCTSKGKGRQGIGSFCKKFLCFSTMPCRQMPLLAYFRSMCRTSSKDSLRRSQTRSAASAVKVLLRRKVVARAWPGSWCRRPADRFCCLLVYYVVSCFKVYVLFLCLLFVVFPLFRRPAERVSAPPSSPCDHVHESPLRGQHIIKHNEKQSTRVKIHQHTSTLINSSQQ